MQLYQLIETAKVAKKWPENASMRIDFSTFPLSRPPPLWNPLYAHEPTQAQCWRKEVAKT